MILLPEIFENTTLKIKILSSRCTNPATKRTVFSSFSYIAVAAGSNTTAFFVLWVYEGGCNLSPEGE